MTKEQFIDLIKKELGVKNPAYAEMITEAVLKTLHDRLTEGQAMHIETHLPKELKPLWSRGLTEKLIHMWRGPEKMTRGQFLEKVQERSRLANRSKAEAVVEGVFRTLKKQLPEKHVQNIAGQLPKDLKDVWRVS